MVGVFATPMLERWSHEYASAEPVAKRFKPSGQEADAYGPHAVKSLDQKPLVIAGPQLNWQDVYYMDGAHTFVPTPPPSLPSVHDTRSRPTVGVVNKLNAPIRTKGVIGPHASHYCDVVTFLWFSSWPVVRSYVLGRQPHSVVNAASLARPEFVRYTRYLIEKADVSAEILTLALLLLYRFREVQAQKHAVPLERHATSEARVVVVALMTANKFLDDISYTTTTWSKMSGIELRELRRMEIEFLTGLEFNLHVPPEQWVSWERVLLTQLYPAVAALR